jgi:hypothetical protein
MAKSAAQVARAAMRRHGGSTKVSPKRIKTGTQRSAKNMKPSYNSDNAMTGLMSRPSNLGT